MRFASALKRTRVGRSSDRGITPAVFAGESRRRGARVRGQMSDPQPLIVGAVKNGRALLMVSSTDVRAHAGGDPGCIGPSDADGRALKRRRNAKPARRGTANPTCKRRGLLRRSGCEIPRLTTWAGARTETARSPLRRGQRRCIGPQTLSVPRERETGAGRAQYRPPSRKEVPAFVMRVGMVPTVKCRKAGVAITPIR
jgi:hypothetical protein